MVALDFPPCRSAGVQRTLKFAEYLLDFGWEPIILTVDASAHESVDESQVVPDKIKHVYRAFSYNASRDFAIKGKYLSIMKEPDRWWTWRFKAVPLGKKLIKQFQPDVIWSTYPISTAHSIAFKLAKWSGIPWVADYRDPVQSRYDSSVKTYLNLAQKIENKTINNASKIVFTTKKASTLYESLYQDLPLDKFHVIENGYDEGNFASLVEDACHMSQDEKFVLLHSGAVYQNGRDPSAIFHALANLKSQEKISASSFELCFRGIDGQAYFEEIESLGINDLVTFKPSVSYMESIKEMMSVDALLLIQGPLFNNQIPGKLFEYIRSGQPILAYTATLGATAMALTDVEMAFQAENQYQLEHQIIQIMSTEKQTRTRIERFSRYEKTRQLATLLEQLG